MRTLRRVWHRFAGTFAGGRQEAELADEIEVHLQMQTDDNLKLGMSLEQARRAAVLKFGGVEGVKESYRAQRGMAALETFLKDVRYSFRGMRRSPGFAAVVVLSLALGIGATTAIFSIVNAILLRPLPYRQPDRLVAITLANPDLMRFGIGDAGISGAIFEVISRRAHSLERSALFADSSFNLEGEGEPERISAARVSADLFDMLGVQPQLGRTFTAEEDQAGRDTVVLISDSLWTRRFARDQRVLGRRIRLDGKPHTVLGVMPPGFHFPSGPESPDFNPTVTPAELWRPLALLDWERTDASSLNFAMVARLRSGYSPEQAGAELSPMAERAERAVNNGSGWTVNVRILQHTITRKFRSAVLILFAAVAVVLLIACANVANLLLARGLSRRAEVAVRLAVGATRSRVVRQMLTEGLIFGACAAFLAIPLAGAGLRALITIAPARIPRIESATIDLRVLGFAFAVAILTTMLFGIAPAFETVRHGLAEAIQRSGRAASPVPSRLRPALVAGQFAVSVVLLVSSALLVRSFIAVAQTPVGFRPENVLTMRLALPDGKYDHTRRPVIIETLATYCATLPGVTAAAAVSTLPLSGEAEGRGVVPEDNRQIKVPPMFRFRAITPAYFRALGIRQVLGREFTANDRGQNPVAIISETAARRLWPSVSSPIGRKLRSGDDRWMTVIGVVGDTRASGIDSEVQPYLYVPFWQGQTFGTPDEFALTVRSAGDPSGLAPAVRSQIWRIDKDLPITHVATMKQLVADSIAPRQFPAVLMGMFACFAVLLAAVGIYGVMSYWVAQRTHEIGIRIALGASRPEVLTEVIKRAGALALAGVTAGLAAAFAITPLLRNLLYGVGSAEPSIFAVCALLLVAVAALASVLPAYRAAKLDPIMCLRHE